MSDEAKKNSLSDLIRGNATPEVKLRVLDVKLEERRNRQDHELNDRWESCCLTVDKRMMQYITQITIICGVMLFSIYQLVSNDSCEAQTAYMGLLTLLLGLIIPTPRAV